MYWCIYAMISLIESSQMQYGGIAAIGKTVKEIADKTMETAIAGINYLQAKDIKTKQVLANPSSANSRDFLNSPIVPTVEERLFMSNNEPVVIPYLVRPEQMLLLMMHD